MVISREIIVPHLASSIDGHILGDPYYYHELALKNIEDIFSGGISKFELRPSGQGIAGIATLCYLVFQNPYSIVVVNALLHATSAVLMVTILMRWFSPRISILASIPLIISPGMIVWFSQINKDSFSLAGFLLVTYGLLKLTGSKREMVSIGNALLASIIIIFGALLIWIVRPYVNQILLPFTCLIFLIYFIDRVRGDNDNWGISLFVLCGALVLTCITFLGKGAASDETINSFNHYESFSNQAVSEQAATKQPASKNTYAKCINNIDFKNWRNEDNLPDFLNKKLKALMGQRCLIYTILLSPGLDVTSLNSIMDQDILPKGSVESLAYLPRAALLGIFSPWPNRWGYIFTNRPSFFYTITPIEAAMLYLGFVSLVIWILCNKAWNALIPIFLSLSIMTIYGMAIPFLGALYRYRYPWWMVVICMGLGAFLTLAIRNKKKMI